MPISSLLLRLKSSAVVSQRCKLFAVQGERLARRLGSQLTLEASGVNRALVMPIRSKRGLVPAVQALQQLRREGAASVKTVPSIAERADGSGGRDQPRPRPTAFTPFSPHLETIYVAVEVAGDPE